LKVEHGESIGQDQLYSLKEEVRKYIKENLRVNPEIELVPPNSIPRETGKVKLIEIIKGEGEKD